MKRGTGRRCVQLRGPAVIFFSSAKRAIGVHGRGDCVAPLTARLGAVGERKILPKIPKAKHDSVSKKTVTTRMSLVKLL